MFLLSHCNTESFLYWRVYSLQLSYFAHLSPTLLLYLESPRILIFLHNDFFVGKEVI